MKEYLIKCDNCGIVKNTSQVTCDVCGKYISEIKLGDTWYNADCVNADCPFKQCDKHLQQLKKIKDKSQYVKVANLDNVCKDYLYYLLEEIEQGGA